MRKIFTSFLVLFFVCSLHGQTNDMGFEFRQKIGFLAAHRGVMAHLPEETAKAFELTYFIHTKEESDFNFICIIATNMIASSEKNPAYKGHNASTIYLDKKK